MNQHDVDDDYDDGGGWSYNNKKTRGREREGVGDWGNCKRHKHTFLTTIM